MINSRPTDPHTADGYTLVFVHVWTKNLSAIKTVVNGLNSTVRVVTPDAFVKLIKANVTKGSSGGSVEVIEDGTIYKMLNFNSGLSLDNGDGTFKFINKYSNLVLDVSGSSSSNGARIQQKS